MKSRAALFAAIAGMAMAFSACQDLRPIKGSKKRSSSAPASASSNYSGKKVKLEFYVMSKCPFGTQVEKGIKPVLDEMGQYIDFHLDFIVNKRGGAFTAMHGQTELDGNIIQLCAIKHYPNPREYMKLISCMNRNMRAIPSNWKGCAKTAGLDASKIETCWKGDEGKTLLAASHAKAQARRAQGSPTMFLNNKSYRGGRSKRSFMRAICTALGADKPKVCSTIPEPVQVNATVLSDKRCKRCNVRGMTANLKGRFFPKLVVKTVDYNTPEGKKLYKDIGQKNLPIWLFDDSIKKAEKYARLRRWLRPKGKWLQLRVGARFDPTAEICDNKKDDTGNGKVDCADPTCKAKLLCRDEIKNKVDVFIMSQCPFGVKAIDAAKEVLANFQGKINFDVHYIATKTATGFKALHGQSEVDENIRQLCAKKYYKKNNKYLEYFWCRNKNYRSSDWKPCAKDGIDVKVIEKCFTGGEGKKLLAEDIKFANSIGVSGSPTWLANNKFKFGGIAANSIKAQICRRNPKLPNCDKKLSAGTKVKGSCGK